jgi:DNA ligase 1
MKFQPLLSATVTDEGLENLRYPVLVSPKLDGIRAIKRDGVVLSRKLKPIRNEFVQSQLRGLPDGLDGELIVGYPWEPDCFKVTTEGVMSKDGTPDFRFYVFDSLQGPADQPFSVRYERLKAWVSSGVLHGRVHLVPHQLYRSAQAVRDVATGWVDEGYEGVMIRSLDGPYKFGRSTLKEGTLLKLKRWQDAEYEVYDFVEQMHNANEQEADERGYAKRSKSKEGLVGAGKVGAVLVRSVKDHGHVAEVGSGFTDAERIDMWNNRDAYRGRVMTVKYQGFTPDMKLRFPIFKGWRELGT